MSQSNANSATSVRRIAIAVARFNADVTSQLLEGCRAALFDAGLNDDDIHVVHVPGAWELPLVCRQLAAGGNCEAVIALGAVIRGETAHFDFISSECARGLMQVSLETDLPVAFGVITPENDEQAHDRADPARMNKGREVALAALEMIALRAEIDSAG